MTRFLLVVLLDFFVCNLGVAQTRMRSVEELIDKNDPGWSVVEKWITQAKNNVEVLPVDSLSAKLALYNIQVTTRSPMGAIVFMTGGILVDHGWIRILGSGSAKLQRTLPEWNKGKSSKESASFLLIADDVIGGFFILNGGALGNDIGKVYYFAPDNLEYEPLDLTYSEFLQFCFNHDLNKFYEGKRWKKWQDDTDKLDGENVFNFYPFLWTKEGKYINKLSRKAISIEEQYNFNLDMRKKLGLSSSGN